MTLAPRIFVQVQSAYLKAQSQPELQRYVFAYTVTLRNPGRNPVQLLRRHWLITNSQGERTELGGEGVIGQQPLILAGDEFNYTSGVILATPVGTMEGHYEMQDHTGVRFHVSVPLFRLAIPELIH